MTDDKNYYVNLAKLKHYCVECGHYITMHVEKGYLESCSKHNVGISPYVDKCLQEGCKCEKYVQPDSTPTARDTAEYLKEYNKIMKKYGLRRVADEDIR